MKKKLQMPALFDLLRSAASHFPVTSHNQTRDVLDGVSPEYLVISRLERNYAPG